MLPMPEKAQILKWTFEIAENVQTKVKYNDAQEQWQVKIYQTLQPINLLFH